MQKRRNPGPFVQFRPLSVAEGKYLVAGWRPTAGRPDKGIPNQSALKMKAEKGKISASSRASPMAILRLGVHV